MYRKVLIIPIFLCSLFFANSVLAASIQVISMEGGIFTGEPYFDAANNRYTVDFNNTQVASLKLQSWSSGFETMGTERTVSAAADGYEYMIGNNFTCNTSYKAFYYNGSGTQIGSLSIVITGIVDPLCDSGGAGNPPAEKCDSCAIFECPGWDEYMGKLDGLKAAIPPPTDWQNVATIFRDTIAPRFKQDLQDVLGSAPSPMPVSKGQAPTKPTVTAPTAPPSLGGVDDNGLEAPTGQEAPGLEDSVFSADDIKNGAPVIPERADPTGGFKFTDPVGSLPSQEDFIKNAPIEGPILFPSPPIGEESVDPGDTFTEPTFTEPTFTEPIIGDGPVIGGPDIDYESMPIPGNAPSAPTDPTYPPPIEEISGNYDIAPIPGADTGTAPIPGEGATYEAPYP